MRTFGFVLPYTREHCAGRVAFRPLSGVVQGRCAALHHPGQPVYEVAALAWACAAAHAHASAATLLNTGRLMWDQNPCFRQVLTAYDAPFPCPCVCLRNCFSKKDGCSTD